MAPGPPTLLKRRERRHSSRFQDGCDAGASRHGDVALLADLMRRRKEKSVDRLACQNIPIVSAPFHGRRHRVTVGGDGRAAAAYPCRGLVATGKPGTLQIRLVDPAGQAPATRIGACTGDSGCACFRGTSKTAPPSSGVVSWSNPGERRFGLRRNDRRDTPNALQ